MSGLEQNPARPSRASGQLNLVPKKSDPRKRGAAGGVPNFAKDSIPLGHQSMFTMSVDRITVDG